MDDVVRISRSVENLGDPEQYYSGTTMRRTFNHVLLPESLGWNGLGKHKSRRGGNGEIAPAMLLHSLHLIVGFVYWIVTGWNTKRRFMQLSNS